MLRLDIMDSYFLQGSLSSLSFTDIYGLSTTTPPDPAMLDLHRRVDKILNNAQVGWNPGGCHGGGKLYTLISKGLPKG